MEAWAAVERSSTSRLQHTLGTISWQQGNLYPSFMLLSVSNQPFLREVCKKEGKGIRIPSPHTPKAPRHGARPPNCVKCTEMHQIAAVLFQESTFPSRNMVPSVLPKPLCKSLVSNRSRVLFYEDELHQAVAQKSTKATYIQHRRCSQYTIKKVIILHT